MPKVSGTNLNIEMVGGVSNATFTLYTATNILTPVNLWSPILTNQFDPFGVYEFDTFFDMNEPARFFRLLQQ